MPGKAETDAVEPLVAAESVSCVELRDRVLGCAMVVAATWAAAEPVPPSMGMAKTKRKRCQRQVKSTRDRYRLWPRRRRPKTRATSFPWKQKGRQSSYVARVRENHEKW